MTERRREVYRNAVEAATQAGVVTERERAILGKLRESLGVTALEAAQIEREVLRTPTADTAPALVPALGPWLQPRRRPRAISWSAQSRVEHRRRGLNDERVSPNTAENRE